MGLVHRQLVGHGNPDQRQHTEQNTHVLGLCVEKISASKTLLLVVEGATGWRPLTKTNHTLFFFCIPSDGKDETYADGGRKGRQEGPAEEGRWA